MRNIPSSKKQVLGCIRKLLLIVLRSDELFLYYAQFHFPIFNKNKMHLGLVNSITLTQREPKPLCETELAFEFELV